MKITDLLHQLKIPYRRAGESHHISSQGWLGIDCPRCSRGSGKFKLGYNLRFGYLSCWTCGHLPLASTLSDLGNTSSRDIAELLAGVEREKIADLPTTGKLSIPVGVGPLLPIHQNYLKRRGFDPEEVEKVWGVKGIGQTVRYAWRLFIPAHYRGKVVSWTTRTVGDHPVRYLASPPEDEDLPLKELLYGEDHVRNGVIACEGPVDAWRIGPGAVALCGVGWTQGQVTRLLRHSTRVICFDNEPAAQRRARKLLSLLKAGSGRTLLVQLDSPDPGSASSREIALLRKYL